MKMKLNRSIFLDEINKANKIVDPKSVNPNLIGIYFDLQPEGLIVISTNGAMSWKSNINKDLDSNFEIYELGKMFLKGKYLLEILRKIEDDIVELEVVEENELIIKGENVRFTLQLLNYNDFPLIGFRENGDSFSVDPKTLKKGMSQVIVSIEEFNKKIAFTGMNFKIESGSNIMTLYATDSFRVSKKTVSINNNFDKELDFTIPFKTLIEIIRLLDTASSAEIIIFDGYIILKIDGHSLFQSTLIEGKFPNVERAFPEHFETNIIIKRNELIRALNRANLTSEEGMTPSVILDCNAEMIRFTSSSPDIGNYLEDFTHFEFSGEEQKVNFNIKFLLDALRVFDTDKVNLNFISPVKPLEISAYENEETLKQLILPLIIN